MSFDYVFPDYPSLPESFGVEGRISWERRYPEIVSEYYRLCATIVARAGARISGERGDMVENSQFDDGGESRLPILREICQEKVADVYGQSHSCNASVAKDDVSDISATDGRGVNYLRNKRGKERRKQARARKNAAVGQPASAEVGIVEPAICYCDVCGLKKNMCKDDCLGKSAREHFAERRISENKLCDLRCRYETDIVLKQYCPDCKSPNACTCRGVVAWIENAHSLSDSMSDQSEIADVEGLRNKIKVLEDNLLFVKKDNSQLLRTVNTCKVQIQKLRTK